MTDMVDIPHVEGDWALRMFGDSMAPYFLAGDLLVVTEQSTAEAGRIVVALIDDKATVRRYRPEGEMVRLEAENKTVEDIVVDASAVTIKGVVTGMVRGL